MQTALPIRRKLWVTGSNLGGQHLALHWEKQAVNVKCGSLMILQVWRSNAPPCFLTQFQIFALLLLRDGSLIFIFLLGWEIIVPQSPLYCFILYYYFAGHYTCFSPFHMVVLEVSKSLLSLEPNWLEVNQGCLWGISSRTHIANLHFPSVSFPDSSFPCNAGIFLLQVRNAFVCLLVFPSAPRWFLHSAEREFLSNAGTLNRSSHMCARWMFEHRERVLRDDS